MSTTAAKMPISTCSALIWLPLFRMVQGLDPSEVRDADAFCVAFQSRAAQYALHLHSDNFHTGWLVGLPFEAAFFLLHILLVFVLLIVFNVRIFEGAKIGY